VAPSIVFFDELDSLVGKRVEGEQTGEVTARILSSFLTEMDGLELAQGVLVMGATNRPQALDAALIRCAALLPHSFAALRPVCWPCFGDYLPTTHRGNQHCTNG